MQADAIGPGAKRRLPGALAKAAGILTMQRSGMGTGRTAVEGAKRRAVALLVSLSISPRKDTTRGP